jgi:hypothetical protein
MPSFTADGGLFIGPQALNSMPPKLRAELLTHVYPGLSELLAADAEAAPQIETEEQEDGVLVDFTDTEFLELLGGCSDKTQQLLTALSKGKRVFNLTEFANKLATPAGKLGGVWSGLTRRTRKLKKNPDAVFVAWEWDPKTRSWVGTLSEATYAAMQKAFK